MFQIGVNALTNILEDSHYHIDEADLLSAMKNAGRQIENKRQQQILQNIGIDTPAIRVSIIETLLSTNYIIRKTKHWFRLQKAYKYLNSPKTKNSQC